MAKPELGSKQKCQNCGTKFFDLGKNPITCPKCGTVLSATPLTARAASRAADPDDEDVELDTGAEVVPLEDADETEDGKVAVVASEDDVDLDEDADAVEDDDTFLEEDEEDDSNVSDLIDGDIENDEER